MRSYFLRFTTSRLRKGDSEQFSKRQKRGTKPRVDLFRLRKIEFNLHIAVARNAGFDSLYRPGKWHHNIGHYLIGYSLWHTADQKTGRLNYKTGAMQARKVRFPPDYLISWSRGNGLCESLLFSMSDNQLGRIFRNPAVLRVNVLFIQCLSTLLVV